MKVLLQQRLRYEFAQFQDDIIDWLVDDDRHVLVQVPSTEGSSTARLDIYNGELSKRTRTREDVRDWISDGRGEPRVYHTINEYKSLWYVRDTPDATWKLLHEVDSIADPARICVVSWSYGGYAALMSAIEEPAHCKCAVSIAGVTDPKELSFNAGHYVGGRATRAFIGNGDEVYKGGSPIERADELTVPFALFHAEEDVNVPFKQSEDRFKRLNKLDKKVEFHRYEVAEHDISPEAYRADLLARLAKLLQENIGR